MNIEVPNAGSIAILDCHRLGKQKYVNDETPVLRPIIFKVNDIFKLKDIFDKAEKLKTMYKSVYFRRHVPKSKRDQKIKLKGKMQELYDGGLQPKWRIDYEEYEYYIIDKNGKTYRIPK